MEVENGCISNIRFLSFRVVFHFHDYGRKGNIAPESLGLKDVEEFPFGARPSDRCELLVLGGV